MYAAFRQLGQIHDIRECSEWANRFEIKFASIFFKCLSRPIGEILLGGHRFTIVAKEFEIPNEPVFCSSLLPNELKRIKQYFNVELLKTPADASENLANALNDDCLREIFKKLSAYQLCSVANVCQRFNGLAKAIFKKSYGRSGMLLMFTLKADRLALDRLSLFQIELCLQTFGDEICAFQIEDNNLNPAMILRMLAVFCKNFEELHLGSVQWTTNMKTDLLHRLPHLKKLDISLADVGSCDISDMFVGDWPLQVLMLRLDESMVTIRLPKLIELNLRNGDLTDQLFQRCLLGNPQIRKMQFELFTVTTSLLHRLPPYLPSCEELGFIGCTENTFDTLFDWQIFTSLKSLILECNSTELTIHFLTSLAAFDIPLQYLSVELSIMLTGNFLYNYIRPLKHIETLKLDNAFEDITTITINQLTRTMTKLRKIIFVDCSVEPDEIKDFLRINTQPIELSILIQPAISFAISMEDSIEITSLLKAHPAMDFHLEIGAVSIEVRKFDFSYLVIFAAQICLHIVIIKKKSLDFGFLQAPNSVRSQPPTWLRIKTR